MHLAGGEGLYNGVEVLVRHGGRLEEEITDLEGSWVVDYAESGERALVVLRNRYMVVIDGEGREESRYICPRPFRGGYLSPRGNYIAEVTAGKYVMIYDRGGRLIAEHHVQGPGNYYAAFSPDERYLCVTPGPWRVYFFETETGEMLWEYEELEPDSFSFFYSPVVSETGISFIGASRWQPLSVLGSAKRPKRILAFDKSGNIIGTSKVFTVKTEKEREFYTWNPTPLIKVTRDGNFLLVRVPDKVLLYRIISNRN